MELNKSKEEGEKEEELDPRIQIELEKLNSATDEINKLEIELDDANTRFRLLLNESTERLKILSKKLGSCIPKARPYFEALEIAKTSQIECQRAAVQFQRANEIHQAAKETVTLAEARFLSKQHEWQFDTAWQEMLNHATCKVVEAEGQRATASRHHQITTAKFHQDEAKVQQLEQQLKRNISKARIYFQQKALCQGQLEAIKSQVESLQASVSRSKYEYAQSLRQLEAISEEIHFQRNRLTVKELRQPGVGSELTTDFEQQLNLCDDVCSRSSTPLNREVEIEGDSIRPLDGVEGKPSEWLGESENLKEGHFKSIEESIIENKSSKENKNYQEK